VPWKNVDLLIQLAADLKLKAVIIGGGPEAQRLEMQASLQGADCLFTGELSKAEILEYLNRSKLFVLFSQYEGLSFALLEAMATGLPSLVSSATGNLAVVSDNKDALVVDTKQISLSYQSISGLIQDHDMLRLFGENARNKVKERFELGHRLEDMLQLIASST
jgi:glycosyltransferase involved in cell wall biosynthesis